MFSVELIDVTMTMEASALDAGDVASNTQTVSNAAPVDGGRGVIRSVLVIDEDDQGAAIDLFFLETDTDLGTLDAAPDITDALARGIFGCVAVATTDYKDLTGVKVATKADLFIPFKAVAGSRDIYVGIVNGAGTPDYTTNGVRLRVGVQWMGS